MFRLLLFVVAALCAQGKFVLLDKWKDAYKPLYYNGTAFSFEPPGPNRRNFDVAVHTVVNNSFSSQGWDYVYFHPGESKADTYLAVGFAEGYLTRTNITDHLALVPSISSRTRAWIRRMLNHLEANFDDSDKNDTLIQPYSTMQESMYHQLQGIVLGYNQEIEDTHASVEPLDLFTLLTLNLLNEIQDIEFATGERTTRSSRPEATMLIQATPYDLFAGHNTIGNYTTMRRQYKTYCLSNTVSFSGYPGRISSGDDWILTSRELVIQSAPLYVFNLTAYNQSSPDSSPQFMRVMAAAYLAKDGAHFCRFLSLNNSGTGNAQYHVLAMSQFRAGNVKSGLLHHLEQGPGLTVWADVTKAFQNEGEMWISTDIPYFSNFSYLGYAEEERKDGGMGIWSNASQPRNQNLRQYLGIDPKVNVDMQHLATVLRTNNFSSPGRQLIPDCSRATNGQCHPQTSAMFPPAARGDLNPEGNEQQFGAAWRWVGHRNSGAIDTKIASRNGLRSGLDGLIMEGTVVCGPTAVVNGRPAPFNWSNVSVVKPDDLPDVYNFTFNTYSVPYPPHGYYTGYPDISAVVAPVAIFTLLVACVATILVRRKLKADESGDPYSESAALLKYRQN